MNRIRLDPFYGDVDPVRLWCPGDYFLSEWLENL